MRYDRSDMTRCAYYTKKKAIRSAKTIQNTRNLPAYVFREFFPTTNSGITEEGEEEECDP